MGALSKQQLSEGVMSERFYTIGSFHLFQIDLAWAAGFWEGEGTCGVYPSNKIYKRLAVSVCQTDMGPIEKFCDLFEGTVKSYDRDGCKRMYQWEAGNTRAYLFLKAIKPFVLSQHKNEQIDNAISQWLAYRTENNKTKHVPRRKRNGKEFYDVRVPNGEGGTKFVGCYKDPSIAHATLLAYLGCNDFDVYQASKVSSRKRPKDITNIVTDEAA